jgi:hemoglobin-like flavoprotein
VTPEELALIARDGAAVHADGASFSARFYETLFEVAPSTRELFPADLVRQRGKLVDELGFLVDAATAGRDAGGLGVFIERARDLGRRHVDYGVTGVDFAPVGVALIAALRSSVPDWDAAHELAWTKLYRLISDVMREGAETRRASSSVPSA